MRLEDYALLGDTQTAALVSAEGAIEWLCLPRFDSGACFAALLGDADNGSWRIAPVGGGRAHSRHYRPGTLVLETLFATETGTVRIVDCMPVRGEAPDVVRLVEGLTGQVDLRMDLTIRFDYGRSVPWVRQLDGGLQAVAGPDALYLRTPVRTRGEGRSTVAEFTVSAGEQVPFVLTWNPSHLPPPRPIDAAQAVAGTEAWWRDWSGRCADVGPHRDLVLRSLITLKALTYAPTGGLVAAPTTSLPEEIGGVRNWDYRRRSCGGSWVARGGCRPRRARCRRGPSAVRRHGRSP